MAIHLFPVASIEQVAQFLGYKKEDIERYGKSEYAVEDDEKFSLLDHIVTFGFGEFNCRLLQRECMDVLEGKTENAEFAVKLLISTSFLKKIRENAFSYDPIKENAFAWAAFFKQTGGVCWREIW